MINLISVTYAYNDQPPVFQEFDWQVGRGEAWAVLGPSGCGKSTLLYLLAGLRFPTSGHVLVDGSLLTRPRPQSGLILQDYGLLPWATVQQNAELGFQVRTFYGPDGKHAPSNLKANLSVDPWLERLGLAEERHKFPGQLSGGQRQRVAIARTLALRPDMLLMDEPFSSLDAPTRESLQALILELRAENNLTQVIVTHAIEEAAMLGQKILLLGQPPNRHPEIIDNSGSGHAGFRDSSEYVQLVRDLRRRMGEG